MTFSIDIERQDGTRYGPGPIRSATRWQTRKRLSLTGAVEMSAPATDDRTSLLRLRRYMRCHGTRAGARTELGLGIIDTIDMDTTGRSLVARGFDLFRELGWFNVSFLELKDGLDPMPLYDALDEILAACNSQTSLDWTLDYSTFGSTGDTTDGNATILNVTNMDNFVGRVGSPVYGAGIPLGAVVTAVDVGAETISINPDPTATASGVAITRAAVFYVCSGESGLAAFARVAEMTGQHFRLGTGRQIVWLHDMRSSSGVRAVIDVDPVAAEANRDICLITSLQYLQDSTEAISHIVPWGSGTGTSRLGLANLDHATNPDPNITTRTPPDGYVMNLDFNVIARTAAQTDYGYHIRHVSFPDIAPTLDDTDPDYDDALVAARNQLFDVAMEYLRVHSYPLESFRVGIAKLDREVLPGETIRLIYRGRVAILNEQTGDVLSYRWVDIDTDLVVLESTTEITDAGVHTPSIVVSTLPRWPVDDRALFFRMYRQLQQAQQHDAPVAFAERAGSSASVTGILVAAGKTVEFHNTVEFAGVDGSVLTIPATGTAALLGTAQTFTANQNIDVTGAAGTTVKGSTSSFVAVDGAAGQNRDVRVYTAGSLRWAMRAGTAAESGSNAGSPLNINAYNDSGTLIGTAIAITRATLDMTFGGHITMTNAKDIVLNTSTGSQIATATGQKLAFHGSTPVIQAASAAQAAVATTAATQTTPWGYASQAQADAIITLLNEIRQVLVSKGLMKGSA